jgi:uncharacterized protein YndB with AHSA1/START domain
MNPTGTIRDGGRTLVLHRRLPVPIEDVWASITESERLGRWFGTWTGDPTTGSVMLTLNAEAEPAAPSRFDIHVCERPRHLSVSTTDEFAHWQIVAELTEVDGGTLLELRQEGLEPGAAPDTGPGWEWYLDRLVASIAGDPPPTLADFETHYLPMGPTYSAMLA